MNTTNRMMREAFLAKATAEADEQIAYTKMLERGGSVESRRRWERARDRRDAIVGRYADQFGVASG